MTRVVIGFVGSLGLLFFGSYSIATQEPRLSFFLLAIGGLIGTVGGIIEIRKRRGDRS